ncbi:verticillium wilt disease resistance protein, partial [Trifolium medium]|nr:verticillium wilt disease resistance protein [Trifolium medium]
CDDKGYVIGLDLSKESISGGFDDASSLFGLQQLQKLNLSDSYRDFSANKVGYS